MKAISPSKCIAILLMFAGLAVSSTSAIAAEPIPFNAMMQSSSAQPAIPPLHEASSQPAAAASQHRPMTAGGKIVTGIGVAVAGFGVLFMAVGATEDKNSFGPSRGACFATGGIFMGIGAATILGGMHWRKAK